MTVTIVEVAGDWREIGQAYGEHLREPIQRAVAAYETIAPKLGGTIPELERRLVPYFEQARDHAPVRFAELEGMAEGAAIDLLDAMLLNCIEELTNVEACTTAAKDGFLVHAEMWYAGQTEIGLLVAAPDEGPAVVAASCVGFLTGVGASAAGFAAGVQSTFARDERVGVPRVMVSRDALCARDLDGAVDAACAPRRAGGYGYVFSTAEERRILETSGTRGELVDAEDGLAVHTNHYLSSLAAVASPGGRESRTRLTAAQAALGRRQLESLTHCQELLCDEGFRPCAPGDSETIFGFACDLETGAVTVSDGDPRQGRWTQLQVPGFRPAGAAARA